MIIFINNHSNQGIYIDQIIEVSIVPSLPLGDFTGDGHSQDMDSAQRCTVPISLEYVEKEQPTNNDNPQKNLDESDPNVSNFVQPKGQIDGEGNIPGEGSPSEVALWKIRAKDMVESLYKPLPDDYRIKPLSKTTYLLMVSRKGEVLDKKLLASSGDEKFDHSILLALNKITRFPPPPLVLIAGDDSINIPMSFASIK